MTKHIMLDESRPFGVVRGDPDVAYKQGGSDFNYAKELIPGSKNSAPALIASAIEKQVEVKPVYSDMHIHALKRHLKVMYLDLEAAGEEFEKVEMGEGSQARIIEFLEAH